MGVTNSFHNYLSQVRQALVGLEEIIKYKAFTLTKGSSENTLIYKQIMHPDLGHMARLLINGCQSTADYNELYVMTKVVEEGPKIFRPTTHQLSMMEKMKLNIPVSEYCQPFPTIIIELPEEYTSSKVVDLPQGGEIPAIGSKPYPDRHQPKILILHYNQELCCLIGSLMFDSDISIKVSYVMRPDDIMEEYVSRQKDDIVYDHTLDCSPEEDDVRDDIVRAAINYCLLLDEIGVKKIGPENEKIYNQLVKYKAIALKERNKERSLKLTNEIKAQPILYTLDDSRPVILYTSVEISYDSTPNDSTPNDSILNDLKRVVGPHHRRGHYRMQAFGPGRTERKRIRIPPVFVNKHLFLGKMIEAKRTYKT